MKLQSRAVFTVWVLGLSLGSAWAQEPAADPYARTLRLLQDTRVTLHQNLDQYAPDPKAHPPAVAAFDGAIGAYERIVADTRPLSERAEAELEQAKAATQLTIHTADMVRAGVTVILDEAVFYIYLRVLHPDFPQVAYVGEIREPSHAYRQTVEAYQHSGRWGYEPALKGAETRLNARLLAIERELSLRALRRKLAEAERDQAELALVQAAVLRAMDFYPLPTPRNSAELAVSERESQERRQADAQALEIANRRLAAATETVTRLRAALAALESTAAEPVAEGAIKKLGDVLKP